MTLDALERARGGAEVIVVDNLSTDRTSEIAASYGVKVITERERNIGRVRNTGAENATGDVVVFLDADTLVEPGLFENILDAMDDPKCVGGSVVVRYEVAQSAWVRWFTKFWVFWGHFLKMRQGALQFCRADIFRELGGYDSTIYVGEDIEFHWRLDKLAKARGGYTAFIEEPPVLTSSRRWDKIGLKMLVLGHPVTIFLLWRVRSVWKSWYDEAIR